MQSTSARMLGSSAARELDVDVELVHYWAADGSHQSVEARQRIRRFSQAYALEEPLHAQGPAGRVEQGFRVGLGHARVCVHPAIHSPQP